MLSNGEKPDYDALQLNNAKAGQYMVVSGLLVDYFAYTKGENIADYSKFQMMNKIASWNTSDKAQFYRWVAVNRRRVWDKAVAEFGLPPLPE